MSEFDKILTCPYCGAKDYDTHESLPDEGIKEDMECGSCGKKFIAERHESVDFESWTLEEELY